mmetsp:Transcript_6473/g.18341  ORF Transcript_6473/g.18341 Transcript_6473/m.18341 type:complete len:324 (-) Transcript_6473:886-1857(-)
MGLRVENVVVERNDLGGGKEKVEVLERLRQEEALLLVIIHHIGVGDVPDSRIPVGEAAVALNGLEHFPSPVPVLLVPREPPQHKKALHRFRPQEVVRRAVPGPKVVPAAEFHNLRRDARLHARVHFVARPCDLLPRREVAIPRRAIRSQREHPAGKAHQVVHFVNQPSTVQLRNVGELARIAFQHHAFVHRLRRLVVHSAQPLELRTTPEIHLEEVLVEAVAKRPQGPPRAAVLARLDAYKEAVQALKLGPLLNLIEVLEHIHGGGGVFRLPREAGQVEKLQLDGAHFGQYRAPPDPAGVVGLPRFQVNRRVGNAVRGLERLD